MDEYVRKFTPHIYQKSDAFLHPSHVPGTFLYKRHERYTCIFKVNRKGEGFL